MDERSRKLRVLVCDDDLSMKDDLILEMPPFMDEDLRTLEAIFELDGAVTVQDARTFLEDEKNNVDLIVLDLFFGSEEHPDGFTFADQLLSVSPDLPVVIWSGLAGQAKEQLENSQERSRNLALGFVNKGIRDDLRLPVLVNTIFETYFRWQGRVWEPEMEVLMSRLHAARKLVNDRATMDLLARVRGAFSNRLQVDLEDIGTQVPYSGSAGLMSLDTEFRLYLLARIAEGFRKAAGKGPKARWEDVAREIFPDEDPDKATRKLRRVMDELRDLKTDQWIEELTGTGDRDV